MASWFAIDLAMGQDRIAAIIGGQLLEVYDDDEKTATPVGDGESFFPCFLGMAMGWSWALFFCHDSIAAASRRAQLRVTGSSVLVGDRQPTVAVSPSHPICAPYVDNANVLAATRRSSGDLFDALVDELSELGFAMRDMHRTESHF
eukprot:2642284-Heterocapsa_arctica.AAC.1